MLATVITKGLREGDLLDFIVLTTVGHDVHP